MREYHVDTHLACLTTLNMKNKNHPKRPIHQAYDDGGPRQICVQTVSIWPQILGWAW